LGKRYAEGAEGAEDAKKSLNMKIRKGSKGNKRGIRREKSKKDPLRRCATPPPPAWGRREESAMGWGLIACWEKGGVWVYYVSLTHWEIETCVRL